MLFMDLEEILKKNPGELEELTKIDLSSLNLNTIDDIKFYSLCNAIMFCTNLEVLIVCSIPGITKLDQHKFNSFFYSVGSLANLKQLDLSCSELKLIDDHSFKLLYNALSKINLGRRLEQALSISISNYDITKERLTLLKAVANISESIITSTKNKILKLSI